MNSEELFEKYQHLAKITVKKLYPETDTYARSKGMQKEDLLQFALIGLWTGCQSYCENKPNTSLKSHLIRNIKWNLFRSVQNEASRFQYYKSKNVEGNKVNIISLNSKINNNDLDTETTFEEITSSDNIFKFEYENTESAHSVIFIW